MVDSRAFGDLELVDDVSPADWIVASVRNFEYDVGSLVPVTFAAYARVLHPASRATADGDPIDVAWSDVAAANGRIAQAAMEWVAITGDWKFEQHATQPGVWDQPPSTGSLPPRTAASLAGVLARFTTTPSDCWFGVWEGYANTPFRQGTVPLIAMPNRRMALLRGPLHAAGTAFSRMSWPDSASLWWPDDRSWCVATDIDLMSTYVGGSAPCIEAVLADERVEAFAVTVDQTVHWQSDILNPTPDPLPAPRAVPRRLWSQPLLRGPSSSTVTSRGPRPTPPGDTPGR